MRLVRAQLRRVGAQRILKLQAARPRPRGLRLRAINARSASGFLLVRRRRRPPRLVATLHAGALVTRAPSSDMFPRQDRPARQSGSRRRCRSHVTPESSAVPRSGSGSFRFVWILRYVSAWRRFFVVLGRRAGTILYSFQSALAFQVRCFRFASSLTRSTKAKLSFHQRLHRRSRERGQTQDPENEQEELRRLIAVVNTLNDPLSSAGRSKAASRPAHGQVLHIKFGGMHFRPAAVPATVRPSAPRRSRRVSFVVADALEGTSGPPRREFQSSPLRSNPSLIFERNGRSRR